MTAFGSNGWMTRLFWRGMDIFRKAAGVVFSVSKHVLAGAVNVIGFTALACLTYLVLLLIALITNQGLGSPLLIVLVPVGSFSVSLVCAAFFLFPSAAAAEWICGKALRINLLFEVPVSFAILFAQVLVVTWLGTLIVGEDITGSIIMQLSIAGFVVLVVPLVIYWWALKAADGVRHMLRALYRYLEKKLRPAGV